VANATRALAGVVFEVEQEGDTLVVVPAPGLGEQATQRFEAGAGEVLELLRGTAARNVLLGFGKTASFNSTALGLILKLGGAGGSTRPTA
jgi:hypothetical protein